MLKPTIVYGKIFNSNQEPEPGVLLKFSLHSPYFYEGKFVNNSEIRVTTNSMGLFKVLLFPSTVNNDNFYYLTITQNIRNEFKIIVPVSDVPLNFSELTFYDSDESMLGNCH